MLAGDSSKRGGVLATGEWWCCVVGRSAGCGLSLMAWPCQVWLCLHVMAVCLVAGVRVARQEQLGSRCLLCVPMLSMGSGSARRCGGKVVCLQYVSPMCSPVRMGPVCGRSPSGDVSRAITLCVSELQAAPHEAQDKRLSHRQPRLQAATSSCTRWQGYMQLCTTCVLSCCCRQAALIHAVPQAQASLYSPSVVCRRRRPLSNHVRCGGAPRGLGCFGLPQLCCGATKVQTKEYKGNVPYLRGCCCNQPGGTCQWPLQP